MSSRNMCLLPRATLHSDSEQLLMIVLPIELINTYMVLWFKDYVRIQLRLTVLERYIL
jgi:hypothetical protein